MAGTRVPLYRSEKYGVLAADADAQIFSLKYDMSHGFMLTPGANTEDLISKYPVAIYSYKVILVGDFHGQLYQTYGDSDDATNLSNYDLSNDEFCLGLKQVNMLAGTSTTLGKTVISYRAKKNPKHLRARFGKWKRPPIYLGPTAGNYWNVSVHNSSDSENRTFVAHCQIESWKQFT